VSAVLDLREGAIFADQFRVVRPLARGGMGAVYVVEQLATRRERALKLMHPTLVSDERSLERFGREAQVSARIESDHVVEVIAAGVDRASSTPWLCMELLRGEELAARLARGPLAPAETREIVRQLGHALGAAHRAGIVHRDLKPENLFLAAPRRQGVPFTLKVLDFGVAALVHEATGKSNATQGVGSPLWMAPEQTHVGSVEAATDVWALGLLAYHLLTGGFYWRAASTEGSTITALLVEVMVEPLVPASARAAEQGRAERLPRGFDGWFARCVVRSPRERFQDASAAITALLAVLDGGAPSLVPETAQHAFAATMAAPPTAPLGGATGPPAAPAPQPAPPTPPAALPRPAARPSGRLLALGALAGVLALCGGVGWLAYRGLASLTVPRLDVVGEDGERLTLGPEGATISLADGGLLVRAEPGTGLRIGPSDSPDLDPPPADGPATRALEVVVDDAAAGAPAAGREEVGEATVAIEASAHGPEPDVAREASEAASARRRRAPAASPVARLLRARLDRCVRGNLEGEPRARWTFVLTLDRLGRVAAARIEGPHAGEPGPYATFRRCVQHDAAGFDPGGDVGPFVLTLP
jgi:tRNA A-37 threonylcarbamoyl transferase component Bud32